VDGSSRVCSVYWLSDDIWAAATAKGNVITSVAEYGFGLLGGRSGVVLQLILLVVPTVYVFLIETCESHCASDEDKNTSHSSLMFLKPD